MKRTLLALVAVSAALTATLLPHAAAQDEPQYLVEVVAFRHTKPFDAGELWTPRQPLFGLSSADQDVAEARAPRPLGRFEPLAADDFRLVEAVKRLSRADGFSVLSHSGWRQSALPDEEAMAKSIAGRDQIGRVNGTVLLSRSRHLRLDFDLTFTTGSGTYPLKQDRRRVQTGVTHYIDHPHFGLLVLVSRAPAPSVTDSP